MKLTTEKRQRIKTLKDLALSMLSAFQNYEENDIDTEGLYDWLEIDAQHLMRRIEKFREIDHNWR